MVYQLSGEFEGRWVYQCLRCNRYSQGSWATRELAEAAERGHFIFWHEEHQDSIAGS